MTRFSTITTGACVVCTVALAACGSAQKADKSGTPIHPTVTLRMQMPDAGDTLGPFFAADVARRSKGGVRIRIDDRGAYDSAVPANELKLAHALRSGGEDIGFLAARAWAADGLPAFKALLVPFTVTTYPVAQATASGPIARDVLQTLPSDVVGLALVPSELRRVLATRAPLTAAAIRGLRLRIIDNPQSAADFRALGVRPVQGMTSQAVYTELRRHHLDGAESSPSFILSSRYSQAAPYLSSYAVFPKFVSIVLSTRAWERLSSEQQSALRAAAADTVAASASRVPDQESTELAQLCRSHIHLTVPSAAQLQALAAAAKPAADKLAENPTAARVLSALRGLPGSGPKRQASALPRACRATPVSAPAHKAASATFPEGVYVVTTTVADLRRGGVRGPDFNRDITYRTTLRGGHWQQTQSPNYPDQCPCSGTYAVHDDQVRFVMLHAGIDGKGSTPAPETVHWSFFNNALQFRTVIVGDPNSVVIYTAHPWRKIR